MAAPALVALLVVGGLASLAAASDDGGDAPELATACNGDERLCDRRLDEVALPATHNSMGAPREDFLFPNQESGIGPQLEAGIRGLLIDTHLGVETPKGVYTLLEEGGKSRAKVEDALGRDAVRTAERLRDQIGYRGGGDPVPYLCHGFCEIGATPAVGALGEVRDFLVSRPGEVLVLSIEDQITPEQTVDVFEESGLLELVWKGSVRPLPTLREMIDRGERVLVMGEEATGDVPWYHQQFELVQETPYDIPSASGLLQGSSCRRNRGRAGNPMLLLNEFVQRVPPRPSDARKVNEPKALAEHARECSRALGAPPSLLAVDFYEEGDVVQAAAILNGERR